MDISADLLSELNAVYGQLERKQQKIKDALSEMPCRIKTGWFNGHYQRNVAGEWRRNAFPIPEVDVIDLCDVEIHLDYIVVTTKYKKDKVLSCCFDVFMEYEFEAYGVENYLSDFYCPGQTVQEMKEKIFASDEEEIGFSFRFPFACEGKQIFEFVQLLCNKGFYY